MDSTGLPGGEEGRGKIIGKCVGAFPFMWFNVSAACCPVCCLLTLLYLWLPECEWCSLFVLFSACWPPSEFTHQCVSVILVWPFYCLLTSLFTVSSYQLVSVIPHLSFSYLLMFSPLCLYFPGCECCPCSSHLLTVNLFLPVSIFQNVAVSASFCLSCCLPVDLSFSVSTQWVSGLFVCLVHHLLISFPLSLQNVSVIFFLSLLLPADLFLTVSAS